MRLTLSATLAIATIAIQFHVYGTQTLAYETVLPLDLARGGDGKLVAEMWYQVPIKVGNYHQRVMVTDICGNSAMHRGQDTQVR